MKWNYLMKLRGAIACGVKRDWGNFPNVKLCARRDLNHVI